MWNHKSPGKAVKCQKCSPSRDVPVLVAMGTPLNSKHGFPLTSRPETHHLCNSSPACPNTHISKFQRKIRYTYLNVYCVAATSEKQFITQDKRQKETLLLQRTDDHVKGKEQSCCNWWEAWRLGFGGDTFVHTMSSKTANKTGLRRWS